jgi:hypothetical protein
VKSVLVVSLEPNMAPGKLAAQSAHAAVGLYQVRSRPLRAPGVLGMWPPSSTLRQHSGGVLRKCGALQYIITTLWTGGPRVWPPFILCPPCWGGVKPLVLGAKAAAVCFAARAGGTLPPLVAASTEDDTVETPIPRRIVRLHALALSY